MNKEIFSLSYEVMPLILEEDGTLNTHQRSLFEQFITQPGELFNHINGKFH